MKKLSENPLYITGACVLVFVACYALIKDTVLDIPFLFGGVVTVPVRLLARMLYYSIGDAMMEQESYLQFGVFIFLIPTAAMLLAFYFFGDISFTAGYQLLIAASAGALIDVVFSRVIDSQTAITMIARSLFSDTFAILVEEVIVGIWVKGLSIMEAISALVPATAAVAVMSGILGIIIASIAKKKRN